MNLFRRFTALLLLACTMALTAGAASADPRVEELTLFSPPNDALVTNTAVNFTWSSIYGNSAKISLRSADGEQKLTMTVTIDGCMAGFCTYPFDASLYNWTWRENTVYKWQVKAIAGGEVVAKSETRTFTTDLLHPISQINPGEGAVVGNSGVTFIWQQDGTVSDYRVVVVRPNGSKIMSAWIDRATACSSDCGYGFSFADLKDGTYKWRVEARVDDVQGKSKSSKRTLVVQ